MGNKKVSLVVEEMHFHLLIVVISNIFPRLAGNLNLVWVEGEEFKIRGDRTGKDESHSHFASRARRALIHDDFHEHTNDTITGNCILQC